MDKTLKFNCTQCGLCCHHIDKAIAAGIKFPYKPKADGTCSKLKDNKCTIYETRPEMCNIDIQAKKHGNIAQYHQIQYTACKQLQNLFLP